MASLLSVLTVVVFGVALARPVHDHWISQNKLVDPVSGAWCCNQQDCQEISGVTESDSGFHIVETGEMIPHNRILWKSQTGHWWRCRDGQNWTRCLIGPPRGM